MTPTSCSGCIRLSQQIHRLQADNQTLRSENQRLQKDLQQLQSENQQLQANNHRLQNENQEIQQKLEQSQREHKRQAAPFSKGPPQANPKPRGRRSGEEHGTHGHRPPFADDQADEILDAPLPPACPHCGGSIDEDETVDRQYQQEFRVIHRILQVHQGTCDQCHRRVRGRHPLQTSDATGAAASQIGPQAQSAVVFLHQESGVSYQKISRFFGECLDIALSPGGAAQIVLRAKDRLKPVYEELRAQLPEADHLTPDETGWRVGGVPVWLHSWVGDHGVTVFAIDPQRNANALQRVIGIDWVGGMTHDGYSTYDRFELGWHQQCVDHALRRAHRLAEELPGRAKAFSQRVITILTEALATRDRYEAGELTEADLQKAHEDFAGELWDLTNRRYANEENARFAKHLADHCEQWFMFLIDPKIPATNYRAEQALRGPIVNRKVWGGNRDEAGKEAQEILSSVLATCKQRKVEPVPFIREALCGRLGDLFSGDGKS